MVAPAPPSRSGLEDVRAHYADLTLGQAFLDRCERSPRRVALRAKERGVWREYTWADYRDRVERFALGLWDLGVRRGDRVAIMADPCVEWLVADLATISLGAVSYGIYTTCSPEEVCFQLQKGGARIFVAENQEYVDKVLRVADRCPDLEWIVVADTRAMFQYRDARLSPFGDVMNRGATLRESAPGLWREQVSCGSPDDVCLMVFTSGTTGQPKAAMITHRTYLLGGAVPFCERYPHLLAGGDRVITHLSLAHAFERIFCLYTPIVTESVLHIGESLEALKETLFEVQPTFFHGVPRIYQKMAAQIVAAVEASTWLKRASYRLAMRVGERYVHQRWTGRVSLANRVAYWLARQLVFLPILNKLGLARATHAIVGGSRMPEGVQRLWQIWGLNLGDILGMTEAGYIAIQAGEYPRPGNVGRPVAGLQVRLAADGELIYRGLPVFRGYWDDDETTQEVFDADGWFHSGDVGEFTPEGYVRLVDRKKDIIITAGGKNLTPSYIESLVKESPYVSECILIADGRKYPSALVEINFETVSEYAREHKIAYDGFTSLTVHPQVQGLVDGAVQAANERLARVEQVKKFRIIPKELDPEEGETTPTRKIKRRHFEQLFGDLIAEMYLEETQEAALLGGYV
jgi:long-chain acyl-CoA synthetase